MSYDLDDEILLDITNVCTAFDVFSGGLQGYLEMALGTLDIQFELTECPSSPSVKM